jgi:segregation and condensation protein B
MSGEGRQEVVESRRAASASTQGDGAGPSAAGDRAQRDPSSRRCEAILLLSREPVSGRKLAEFAGLADATEARTLVRHLNEEYDAAGRAYRIVEVASGYQLLTRPSLARWLRRLDFLPSTLRLTTPLLETLAIVAYRQPVLRAQIEAIRGVNCGEILRQLLERDLVRINGRSTELGRPYLYGTTKRFLQVFGLRNIAALPHVEWMTQAPPTDDGPANHEQVPGNSDKEPPVTVALAAVSPAADLDAEAPLQGQPQPIDFQTGWSPRAAADEEDEGEDEDEEFFDDDDEEDDDEFDDEEDDEEEFDDEEEDELDEEEGEEDDLEEEEWEEVDEEEWDEEEEGDEEEEDEEEEEWEEGDEDDEELDEEEEEEGESWE